MNKNKHDWKHIRRRSLSLVLALVTLVALCVPSGVAFADESDDSTAAITETTETTSTATNEEIQADTSTVSSVEQDTLVADASIVDSTENETLTAPASDTTAVEPTALMGDDGISTAAYSNQSVDMGTYTVEVGSTITLPGTTSACNSINKWEITSGYSGAVSLSKGTVTGKYITSESITIQHTYCTGNHRGWSHDYAYETFTVNVVAASGKVKVYVYVAGSNFSDEMYDLLKIDKSTLDKNGYFPVGSIELDASYFNGKNNKDTAGSALINSADDWTKLMSALSEMDVNALTDDGTKGVPGDIDFTKNNGNLVKDYLKQASQDIGAGWGSQKTALFRWHTSNVTAYSNNRHCGYDSTGQSIKYHLDLKFNTNEITFKYGNNGLDTDLGEFDSRTYITGSEIQEPKNGLNIPDGYRTDGKYYKDADCTEEYTGLIGSTINSDITVYVKVWPKDNVPLYYKVAQGEGSVSTAEERLNPDTGVATGSTATSAEDYKFDGWYSDEACTNKLSDDASFVPTKPDGGWVGGTTYYAKFVPMTGNLTVQKNIVNNGIAFTEDELTALKNSLSFTVTGDDFSQTISGTDMTVSEDGMTMTYTIENLPVGNYTVTEDTENAQVTYYTCEVTGNGDTTSVTDGQTATATITNTYTDVMVNLTINKTVTGDNSKAGNFTFTAKNERTGVTYTATISTQDTGSYTISNIPAGEYTVTELESDNYECTDGSTKKVTIASGTGSVSFTNKGEGDNFQYSSAVVNKFDHLVDNLKVWFTKVIPGATK
jgi:hypothetical protein